MKTHGPSVSERKDYDLKFEADLSFGEAGEGLAASLVEQLTSGSIEVKRDRKLSDTGNVAIEYACSGRPSGIRTTKAKYWAIVLSGDRYRDEAVVFIDTARLRKIADWYSVNCPQHVFSGGDRQAAKFVALPVAELLRGSLPGMSL